MEPGLKERATSPDGSDLRSVVGKIETILACFTIDDDQISLAELVRRTALPKTTLHRLCQVLTAGGFLERSEGQYRLGLRLFELGQRVPRQRILRDAARPYMQRLLYQTKSVVHLVILDGLEALVIERLSPFTAPTRHTQIAGRMPLHCTAAGKALLAFSAPDLATEVMREGLQRRTPHTITTAMHFTRALQKARATGIATEIEEMHVGYLAVGAPVLSPQGTAMAALSVTAPVHNWRVEQLTALVRDAAALVGHALRGPED